jgi:hypothetical protein
MAIAIGLLIGLTPHGTSFFMIMAKLPAATYSAEVAASATKAGSCRVSCEILQRRITGDVPDPPN